MAIIPFQSRLLAPLKIATWVNMLLASDETSEKEDENSLRRRWDTRTLQTRSLAWSAKPCGEGRKNGGFTVKTLSHTKTILPATQAKKKEEEGLQPLLSALSLFVFSLALSLARNMRQSWRNARGRVAVQNLLSVEMFFS